ncbi:MAG: hypothetical protein ACHQ1H_10125 [Nitrososphaerales archaeon]
MFRTSSQTKTKITFLGTLVAAIYVASLFVFPLTAYAAGATVTLSPTSASVGQVVKVTGTGFQGSSSVTVTFNGKTVATTTSDVSGAFSTSFTVPSVAGGTYPVTATSCCSGGIVSASANLVVKAAAATMKLSPVIAGTGKVVTVTGSGFGASKTITVSFGTRGTIATTTSDSTGAFSTTFTVPVIAGGKYKVNGTDGTIIVSKTFTIRAHISEKPVRGSVGSTVTLMGTGYAANSAITVTFNGASVATGTSDSTGSFSLSYQVPNLVAGSYSVVAKDAAIGSATDKFTIV